MSFCIATVAICDRMRLIVITTAKIPKITVMLGCMGATMNDLLL